MIFQHERADGLQCTKSWNAHANKCTGTHWCKQLKPEGRTFTNIGTSSWAGNGGVVERGEAGVEDAGTEEE